MELKLKGDTFYLLDAGEGKRVYDDESHSVEALELLVSQKGDKDLNFPDILEVNIREGWQIKSLPWSRIIIWESAKPKAKKLKPRLFNAKIRFRNSLSSKCSHSNFQTFGIFYR